MNKKQTFYTIYFSFDLFFEETKDEDLDFFLSDMNPFVFSDGLSADPAIYSKFNSIWTQYTDKADLSLHDSYHVTVLFLNDCIDTYYPELKKYLSELTFDDWCNFSNQVLQMDLNFDES